MLARKRKRSFCGIPIKPMSKSDPVVSEAFQTRLRATYPERVNTVDAVVGFDVSGDTVVSTPEIPILVGIHHDVE